MQAQEPRAAKLAFRARATGFDAAAVDAARTEERSLFRTWMMRKTIHLVASEDAEWIVPLFAPAILPWSRRRLAGLGLDARAQDRAIGLMQSAVDREGPLTRSEIAERLQRKGVEMTQERKVHLWLLAVLAGELCLGPDRGGQTCLVRTADWLGELRPPDRDRSLAELARRYLRGYGPADERDLARWSGLPLRDTSLGFERIAGELSEVEIDGQRLAVCGKPPRQPRGPVVRMLGAYDNFNLGWQSRDFSIAPEHVKQLAPGGGIIRPAVVVDGRVEATWTSKRSGKRLVITIEPFAPLDDQVEAAIDDEIADIGRFEGFEAARG